jgi:hypothetical protein
MVFISLVAATLVVFEVRWTPSPAQMLVPTGPDAGTSGPDAGPTGPDAGPTGPDAGPTGPDAGHMFTIVFQQFLPDRQGAESPTPRLFKPE